MVELRFFGGLSVEDTAEVLKISPQSVMRDWKLSRAWLMRSCRSRNHSLAAFSHFSGEISTGRSVCALQSSQEPS